MESRTISADLHEFEDGIEFCLAAVDDSKTLQEAHSKIEGYLALVHEKKFEAIRTLYQILPETSKNGGEKNGN